MILTRFPFAKKLLKKTGKLFVVLALVSVFSFVLVQHSPINPVNAYVGADMLLISTAQKEAIAKKWGLDQPPLSRFFNWSSQLIKGDFGVSMLYNEPVISVIGKRFMVSIWLMIIAWVLSGVIGFFLGIVAGMYTGSIADRIISVYSYTIASTPTFWLGIILLMFFSVYLGITPISGAIPAGTTPDQATFLQKVHHIILPALSLSVISIANVTLHTREKVIEILKTDYVIFARAQGETDYGIARHHIFRNALIPAITLQFASIGEIFGGAVFAEQVFSYPGLGKASVEAGIKGDVPLLLGIVIFSTIFIFTGNAIADFIYEKIDPRIETGNILYGE